MVLAGAIVGSVLLGLAVGWFLDTVVARWAGLASEAAHPKRRSRTWPVMALTAAGFAFAYVRFDATGSLVLAWWFIAVMILIAFIDLELMIIPNKIVLPSTLVGLGAAIAIEPQRWWVHLAAAVGAALVLLVLALLWRGGMGAGDVKMALLMGAVLGSLVVVALFLAFILSAIIGIVLIAAKRKTPQGHDSFWALSGAGFGPRLAVRADDGRRVPEPSGLGRSITRPHGPLDLWLGRLTHRLDL